LWLCHICHSSFLSSSQLFLLCFLWPCHMCHFLYHFSLPFYSPKRVFFTLVPFLSTLKAFYLYCLLSSYCLLSYSTLHHSTCQHFKFILGSNSLLFSFFLIPTVSGQAPKPFITPTFSFSFSL